MSDEAKPKLEVVRPEDEPSINKPAAKFDMSQMAVPDDFVGIQRMPMALQLKKFSDLHDFGRVHPDEANYWTPRVALVDVPIKGQTKKLRCMIRPDLAAKYLAPNMVDYRRIALACDAEHKPFLCEVPTENLENIWNSTSLLAIEDAKVRWVRADSNNKLGMEGYERGYPENPARFGEPNWPTQAFSDILATKFTADIYIDADDHPLLLRLRGA